jgi:hypothetical protein
VIGPLLEVEQLLLVLEPDEADTLLRVVSSAESAASDKKGKSSTWVMYMFACWMMNALLGSSLTSSIPWLYCGNPDASQSSGT